MHHLLEVLFPYIVLFYIFDCFVYLKSGQAALSSHFGTAYRFKKPGFRFFGISPTCRLFVSLSPSFLISPKGLFLLKPGGCSESDLYRPEAFEFTAFDKDQPIETEGSLVKLGKGQAIDVYSPVLAKQTADTFRTFGGLPPENRPGRIKTWVRNQYDQEKIKERWQASIRYFSLLGVMGGLLFGSVFILLPLILYGRLPIHLSFLLSGIVFFYTMLLLTAAVYIGKIRNPAAGGHRLILSLMMSPATAAHPVHHFTKHLFYSFDILAVSAFFSRPVAFGEELKKELKRLHFSILQNGNSDLTECLRLREACLNEFLTTAGMSPADVLMPPPKNDRNAHSYCPFCETEFLKGVKVCPDCGIGLETFEGKAGTAP